jgi:5-methylcytosine-specific restriction endonuclease McrA
MPKPKNTLQIKWQLILFPQHKHQWKTAYKKVRSKLSNWRSVYKLNLEEKMIDSYGKDCCYCKTVLNVRNMSADHKNSQFSGGENTLENIEIICNKCNRRKGILSKETYTDFIEFIKKYNEDEQKYFLRKMGSYDKFGA